MRILQQHHIVDLFVWVEDNLPKELSYSRLRHHMGRPPLLSISETVTILLFSGLTAHQKLLKDVWKWVITNHSEDFNIPCYSKFIQHCHHALPYMCSLLEKLLSTDTPIRILDSTMLPVRRNCRADSHKVAKEYAAWGKNHQGWYYGLKLHAACDLEGKLSAVYFTPANEHDAQQIPRLVNDKTDVAIGDGTYGARVMRERIWKEHRCFVLAPPHPKQNKKIATKLQIELLHVRQKIECVFDYLKQHLHMITSFPRSMNGYLLNYVRTLLTYQMGRWLGV